MGHLDNLADTLSTPDSTQILRIGKVTAVDADNSHVQIDATGPVWLAADSTETFVTGDRVYAVIQGHIGVVVGKFGGGGGMPVGAVTPYAGSSSVLPYGWLKCDGAAVSRTDYPLLFTRIGTTYGVGNGLTTFNLPNLANRFPLAEGTRARGGTGGTETVTLTIAQLPVHDHWMNRAANGVDIMQGTAGPAKWAAGLDAGPTGERGSGQSHENMPPFLVFAYLIKAL